MSLDATVTAGEAARLTGVSRRTILRRVAAGEIEGATRTDTGAWSIPTRALLAAGYELRTPPDPEPVPEVETPDRLRAELDAVRADLADMSTRLAVAEALADERGATIAHLREQLTTVTRALPAADPAPTPTPEPAPVRPGPGRARRLADRARRWWNG